MTTDKGFLKQIHPVLPVKDVSKAVAFYVDKLGFKLAFIDKTSDNGYAGVCRDGIEIHLQWHNAEEWEAGLNTQMLRIYVNNITSLFEEYKTKEVFHQRTSLEAKIWGTTEFAFYDLCGNGLTFYRDL